MPETVGSTRTVFGLRGGLSIRVGFRAPVFGARVDKRRRRQRASLPLQPGNTSQQRRAEWPANAALSSGGGALIIGSWMLSPESLQQTTDKRLCAHSYSKLNWMKKVAVFAYGKQRFIAGIGENR